MSEYKMSDDRRVIAAIIASEISGVDGAIPEDADLKMADDVIALIKRHLADYMN